jgi:heterodisulfide reductase subunit C/quinone-modifying oxidoreductase subunit QmoC
MYTLKRMAIERGKYHRDAHADFSNSFIGYVEQYGRSFEFGLATRYHLTHHPLDAVRKGGLGFQMLQKGRLSANPERIENISQLSAILAEAKRITAEEQEV